MTQQTAVEWLMENIQKVHKMDWDIVFVQAMMMEKEQIELAYKNGINDEFEHWMNNQERITSLSYYKRAYKKNEY